MVRHLPILVDFSSVGQMCQTDRDNSLQEATFWKFCDCARAQIQHKDGISWYRDIDFHCED